MDFDRQIAYNNWANMRILDAIGESEVARNDDEVLKQLGHLLNVQILWYNRVMGIDGKTLIWPTLSFKECEKLILDDPVDLNKLIPKSDEICAYRNSQGDAYESKVSDIIQHLIVHGQHHRAQIALLLRQKGITPPGTDLIYFTRQE